jgi:hypothetical protein
MNKEEKNQLIETLDGLLNDNNNFYLAAHQGSQSIDFFLLYSFYAFLNLFN